MKKFFLLLIVLAASVAALLAIIPPLLSLPTLRLQVEGQLQQELGQPVTIGDLRLQVFPRPAFVAENVVLRARQADGGQPWFCCPKVQACLDLWSLLQANVVFSSLVMENPGCTGSWNGQQQPWHALMPFLPAIAKPDREVIPGSVMDDGRYLTGMVQSGSRFAVRIIDGSCRIAGFPGLSEALQLEKLNGRYAYDPGRSGSQINGMATCLGGRISADFFWYTSLLETGQQETQVDGTLEGVGILLSHVRPVGAGAAGVEQLEISHGSADVAMEFNGRLEKGLAVHCQASINQLAAVRAASSISAKRPVVQDLSAELVASGYLALLDGYVNLKSSRLTLPGSTTVFSKGLIKYNRRLVLDLLNSVSSEHMETLLDRLPGAVGNFADLSGSCTGEVNIIGNLAVNPVVRLNLAADRLSLHRPDEQLREQQQDRQSCSPLTQLENVLAWSMASKWLADVSFAVNRLDFCDLMLEDVSLVGKKTYNQLYVERFSGKVDDGLVRISLVVDDLLHEPLWNGSLVVQSLDLAAAPPSWPMGGILDASLIFDGSLPAGVNPDWLSTLRGNGTITVNKGSFRDHQLTRGLFSFAPFLMNLPAERFFSPFTRLQLPMKIANRACRLQSISLVSPWYQLQGSGLLDFNSQLMFQGEILYGDPDVQTAKGRALPFRQRVRLKGPLDHLAAEN
ncbi:MAG: hypothetical protein JXO49_02270 [Deltaproteobacteria bacterium]|nr:hypothetical protein [Candidatus Anaeroferrophillus wilburensis]MBN2888153.1 hypothetical protein [Deltaproteobacteria bacterium]